MPRPLAEHGTTNRWRTGCHCTPCRAAHAADTSTWVRARANHRFPPQRRRRLLRLLRKGVSITAAAEQVGVTVQTVHARNRIDPEWSDQLDEALMAGRDPDVQHGTPGGYRTHRCRCPECRRAHHPTPD